MHSPDTSPALATALSALGMAAGFCEAI